MLGLSLAHSKSQAAAVCLAVVLRTGKINLYLTLDVFYDLHSNIQCTATLSRNRRYPSNCFSLTTSLSQSEYLSPSGAARSPRDQATIDRNNASLQIASFRFQEDGQLPAAYSQLLLFWGGAQALY